ncbi:MAG: MlaD family protein [Alphaproteobacteria bacterium]
MRSRNLNYVAVGFFVLAMLGATIGAVVVINGRARVTDGYYVVLDNVADVKFGTQVRYEGYPVGQVEDIEPEAEGARMRFRVHVGVERGWRIPADSVARIGSTSFLAAKTIDIASGRSAAMLSPGDTIAGAPPADVFAVMSAVAGEVSDLNRDSVKPLIARVDGMVARLGSRLERDLTRLLATLNTLAETVNKDAPTLTASFEDLAGELNASARNLRRLLSPGNVETVERVLVNVEGASLSLAAVTRDLETTGREVGSLMRRLDAMVSENRGDVDKSLRDARYTLRAVAQNINAIMHNLDGTSRNMNEFSRMIRRNPGLLLGGPPPEEVVPAARVIDGTSG